MYTVNVRPWCLVSSKQFIVYGYSVLLTVLLFLFPYFHMFKKVNNDMKVFAHLKLYTNRKNKRRNETILSCFRFTSFINTSYRESYKSQSICRIDYMIRMSGGIRIVIWYYSHALLIWRHEDLDGHIHLRSLCMYNIVTRSIIWLWIGLI